MGNSWREDSSDEDWSLNDSWTEESWNLDITEARDRFDQVRWPTGPEQQALPPLVLFGYFPHFPEVPQSWLPPRIHFLRRSAFKYIFQTGNKNPPVPFDTSYDSLERTLDLNPTTAISSLARWRSEREFRACMWLHQIRLWRESDITKFSMSGFFETGWTPPRVASLAERVPFPSFQGRYTKGQGIIWPKQITTDWKPWGAHIKISAGFRINDWLPRFGSYLLWGRGVPYMRMTLDLEVRCDGAHRATFNGSYIPSQVCQVGAEYETYDMVRDIGGYSEVKRALGVGFGVPAPERKTAIERIIR